MFVVRCAVFVVDRAGPCLLSFACCLLFVVGGRLLLVVVLLFGLRCCVMHVFFVFLIVC